MAEGFEFGDQAPGFPVGVEAAGEEVSAELAAGRAGGDDVPDDHEHRVRDDDDRFLLGGRAAAAAPFPDVPAAGRFGGSPGGGRPPGQLPPGRAAGAGCRGGACRGAVSRRIRGCPGTGLRGGETGGTGDVPGDAGPISQMTAAAVVRPVPGGRWSAVPPGAKGRHHRLGLRVQLRDHRLEMAGVVQAQPAWTSGRDGRRSGRPAPGLLLLRDFAKTRDAEIAGCGLTTASGRPLPDLKTVLGSHTLIHAAEGEFYRDALARACGAVKHRRLSRERTRSRRLDSGKAERDRYRVKLRLGAFGKALGPPWTADEKLAAMAAWLALAA